MPTVDVSSMEVAQLHLRHLVGGRARSFTGSVPNEKIYQVSLISMLYEPKPLVLCTAFSYLQVLYITFSNISLA